MKKLIVLAMALILCCSACGTKKTDDAASADTATTTDSKAASASDNADLDKLLKDVEISPKGLAELYKGKQIPQQIELDKQLINHENPVVRAFVYNRTTRNYSKEDELKVYVDHLKVEKDPTVIEAGIRSFMNDLQISPDLYALVKEAAKNDNAKVRAAAAYVLSNSNNKAVDGIYDEAVKLLGDSDNNVRKNVCRYLPAGGNEAVVAEIVKILNSTADNDVAIHGECLEGLISMWYDAPTFGGDRHSEAAYKATIDYLKTTPRTQKIPAWFGMSKLGSSAAKHPEWKEASTFVKTDEVVAVMSDIVKDTAASFNARNAAVKAVAAFGAKSDLEALDSSIDAADQQVKKAIASALAKM